MIVGESLTRKEKAMQTKMIAGVARLVPPAVLFSNVCRYGTSTRRYGLAGGSTKEAALTRGYLRTGRYNSGL